MFSKLLLLLSINNPTHMYLGDLRVYFRVQVYFRETWSRMEEYRKKLVDYANTTNAEFIVDPKVLCHGWSIYSYLHKNWSSECQGRVHIGSLTTLWHDHIACIDDTACPGKNTAFWLPFNRGFTLYSTSKHMHGCVLTDPSHSLNLPFPGQQGYLSFKRKMPIWPALS